MATDDRTLPTYDELPAFKDFTGCAWEVWGKDDQLGTVNLLTDEVVKEAAKEITTPASFFQNGEIRIADPTNVDPDLIKFGIHNWAQRGICGRGVLLDMVKFYCDANGGQLPYDPMTTHAVPTSDLVACAKKEGITFRRGDILLLRVGFIQKFYSITQEERDSIADKPETFAGIEQSEDMKRFLWDNHFAAVASDQPALERWPPPKNPGHLHQTILGLWGMPIGEFFDLEALSKQCSETGRYTFFFSSWPLNVLGGVASPPNAAAYF
ncbi:hypothetical protein BN946_scf184940.g89 [Trametes cinnabarina]|uniref:Cyclase n=1 Tax=Pycnoporus cinnabarinus TaxID=5643 RepID=A0A060SBR0_PYCCI|nr:hypothetical protein BN946_scf184940.g89 [Trametes cinnabarina]